MLASVQQLLTTAQEGRYALGAFNAYNLEGVMAVIRAAESESSPVILQVHHAVLEVCGPAVIPLCLGAARSAQVPVGVHLDHSTSPSEIRAALEAGVASIMADGSHLPLAENLKFCREMAAVAHAEKAVVEVELGRIGGTEDGLTVEERNARLTDPTQAADFIQETRADFLAICIGNVHGKYRSEPVLDLDRLSEIRKRVQVPLVLHGASGLPSETIRQTISLGVCKFNVNTEVREAFVNTLSHEIRPERKPELLHLMQQTISSMQAVVVTKLREFGSSGRAALGQASGV